MSKLSNSALLRIFTKILVLLVIAKALSLALLWYLPSDGIDITKKENLQPKYQRVDFKSMVKAPKVDKVATKAEEAAAQGSIGITNMILKGLYGNANKGFIIVALKSAPNKTTIVGVEEVYSGFTLKRITINSAIFNKANKEYILNLNALKNTESYIKKVSKSRVKARVQEEDGETVQKDVTRYDILAYAKNPKQIWKDIGIKEIKKGKKIEGFRVTRINPSSKMATLGLKKGDIIIKANNVTLKSYKDAIDIYKKIDKLDTIQIVVIRNNEEKELVYEIY